MLDLVHVRTIHERHAIQKAALLARIAGEAFLSSRNLVTTKAFTGTWEIVVERFLNSSASLAADLGELFPSSELEERDTAPLARVITAAAREAYRVYGVREATWAPHDTDPSHESWRCDDPWFGIGATTACGRAYLIGGAAVRTLVDFPTQSLVHMNKLLYQQVERCMQSRDVGAAYEHELGGNWPVSINWVWQDLLDCTALRAHWQILFDVTKAVLALDGIAIVEKNSNSWISVSSSRRVDAPEFAVAVAVAAPAPAPATTEGK